MKHNRIATIARALRAALRNKDSQAYSAACSQLDQAIGDETPGALDLADSLIRRLAHTRDLARWHILAHTTASTGLPSLMACAAAESAWQQGYGALRGMTDAYLVLLTPAEAYSVHAPVGSWEPTQEALAKPDIAAAHAIDQAATKDGSLDLVLEYLTEQFPEADLHNALRLRES